MPCYQKKGSQSWSISFIGLLGKRMRLIVGRKIDAENAYISCKEVVRKAQMKLDIANSREREDQIIAETNTALDDIVRAMRVNGIETPKGNTLWKLDRKRPVRPVQTYSNAIHEALESQTLIYYIQCLSGDNPIKIGVSRNLEKRLKDLQGPFELRLLAVEPGNARKERLIHERFSRQWILGEWFKPADDLLSHIQKVRLSHPHATSLVDNVRPHFQNGSETHKREKKSTTSFGFFP